MTRRILTRRAFQTKECGGTAALPSDVRKAYGLPFR
jgi:hypothetical protein